MAVFAFGVVSSASAKEVLYKLSAGTFPATFTSSGGGSTLEQDNKEQIKCTSVTDNGTIGSATEGEGKTAHLGTVNIIFKGCTTKVSIITAECQSAGAAQEEIVLPTQTFHLGLVDPGDFPGQLLLPNVKFVCEALGQKETVEVKGSVIGELQTAAGARAKAGEKAKEAKLNFAQTGGHPTFVAFLLSLTSPENQLDIASLKTTTGKTTLLESGETSLDTLKAFKNSAGTEVEIELVEG
jgi:hypothetical protein